MSAVNPRSKHLHAVLYVSGAVALFAAADALAKYLGQLYPIPFVVWARYVSQCLAMVLIFAPRLRWDLVQSENRKVHLIRGLLLWATTALFFASLNFMPLADASAIAFMSPLIVVILSRTMLGEPVSSKIWLCCFVAVLGMIAIIRPGTGSFSLAALLPAASALCYAVYQILTRTVSARDSIVVVLFLPTLVASSISTLSVPFFFHAPTATGAIALAGLGALGGGAHLMLTKALRSAPASLIASLMYSQLGWAVLLGYVVFNDLPDRIAVFGILMIGAASFYAVKDHDAVKAHD
ncbi:hypothetical protein TSA1_10275 [Bradyrhizobium nitroreducens]|uniref:EamA domain-containing protein n=1 Tax=Bradyrhizobium nitroreducens TaxID=709803 RepID=A0A2M6U954_9BRAD|nr:DMT family transporter [Bradyrhizobium nitroreducens]PIT01097.1 hypothetical protein TSA1_10275 [Bradyrhizobium nitroreducens]